MEKKIEKRGDQTLHPLITKVTSHILHSSYSQFLVRYKINYQLTERIIIINNYFIKIQVRWNQHVVTTQILTMNQDQYKIKQLFYTPFMILPLQHKAVDQAALNISQDNYCHNTLLLSPIPKPVQYFLQ